jgi:hypothetical protein
VRAAGATHVLEACPQRPAASAIARPRPKEPERRSIDEYVMPEQPEPGRTLHELAACWMPNEPETRGDPDDYVMAKAPRKPSGADTGQASRRRPPELSRRR